MTAQHELTARVKIAIGVARGLVFLRTQHQLANFSLQMHNILLDEELNAKLSDFDVAMLIPSTDATFHFDLDSFYDLKAQSGVFGFGVILMELLTGKPINDEDDLLETNNYLPREHGLVMKTISLDNKLRFDFLVKRLAVHLALLAHKCVQDKSYLRPTLESVLKELEEIYDDMLNLDDSGK